MHFPWWYVPELTSPMLIALVAILHVLVAHYAVGGGFFLAVESSFAYRTKDQEYLDYLKRHARFFILLTVVFGAITGVGIWWTIGLASPLPTALLIQTFVFGWATEWVFFVIELTAAFLFYGFWGKLPVRLHQTLGWIYAWAAWMSLVLITGITAFMLHPGRWLEDQSFWSGFFNPQFWPQVVARTGGALLLSSLYVYLHVAVTEGQGRLRDLVENRSARPALLGAILITLGGLGWFALLPESARAVMSSAAVITVLMMLIFVLTAVVFVLLYVGPYRNPGWLSPGFAGALFLFGIAAFSTGEYIREAVRKPYIVYNKVFGNQIFVEQVPELRQNGYLEGGVWTRAYVAARYPQVMNGRSIDEKKLLELPQSDQVKLGEVLFQYHCNDCHATTRGYSAVGPLLRGWSRERIQHLVEHLDEGHFFMPPWCGTPEEAEILTSYLETIALPRPAGMLPARAQLERP